MEKQVKTSGQRPEVRRRKSGDLARRAVAQATRLGAEILTTQEVTKVRAEGPSRLATLADGTELSAMALLVATGMTVRKPDIAGLDKLVGPRCITVPHLPKPDITRMEMYSFREEQIRPDRVPCFWPGTLRM